MKMRNELRGLPRRLLALLLAVVMVAGYFPNVARAAETEEPGKIADTSTWGRLDNIYGNNTLHAGKVTVDKSVNAGDENGKVTVEGETFTLEDETNFLVTVSQAAQVMALTTEMQVPVDVVFVLDTSGSMEQEATNASGSGTGKNRSETMVDIVNKTIEDLMAANRYNRVGIVAFSAYNAGGVDARGDAANILSGLAHYTGEAATDHLQWDNRRGQGPVWAVDAPLIRGRNANGSTGNGRAGYHGATNIQAGLAKGASLLMNANPVVNIDGQNVTRMPFLILLSDGAPVASSSNNDWHNPSMTLTQGTHGDPLQVGNCFLPLLTAAYYKQQISQKYYPNGDGELAVYTMGFAVAAKEQSMSTMTLNPAVELFDRTNEFYSGINTAWKNYADNNKNFSVAVGRPAELANGYDHDGNYYFYYTRTTKNVDNVNDIQDDRVSKRAEDFYGTSRNVTFEDNIIESIIPSDKSIRALAYNDGYFDVNNADALENAFDSIMTEIAHKAISSPTRVTTTSEFDGYVTFTDIIGEYMEVKDMKGVLVGDTFYQGRHVARNIGTNGTDTAFDAMLRDVIATRITMADSTVSKEVALRRADALIAASQGATYNGHPTQAFYNETTGEYSNSVVWYGKSYTSGDGFEHGVQYIAPAVDDSYEYLTDENTASAVAAAKAAGADTVCRSYFLYGTAETAGGSQTTNKNNQYMYFMIRVERSLNAPYQQRVTVSAPASLLSMEKVYVTEDTTSGTTTYTVEVEESEPAHVIYEVGLRSDINEYNVATKINGAYTSETPIDGEGHVNYDDGTYYFFTNDWDRQKNSDTHTRAMSKASFYAAENNSYYTYQENTYLYEKVNGRYVVYTGSNPQGKTLYYMRDVYSWGTATDKEGNLVATKTQEPIEVKMPASIPANSTRIIKDSTGWYIAKGVYTAAVSSPDGVEQVPKGENKTDTSNVVAYPVRTGDPDDSHYTVYLGNNGVLGLKPADSKTVSIDLPANATEITDDNGKSVMVGQTLTYTIDVANTTDKTATVTATDTIPNGTKLVAGSVTENGKVQDNVITWSFANMAPGAKKTVSFQVEVTEDVLTGEVEVNEITNTASVKIGNTVLYNTNTTHNPPEGKKAVAGSDTQVITGPLKVGDVITYRIRYYNDAVDKDGNPVAADITITDIIPDGTTYHPGSASHQESLVKGEGTDLTTVDGKLGLKWVIKNVHPGASGVVSFRVVVDASAAETIENDASIKIGDNDPHDTNKTTNTVDTGDISISKTVVSDFNDEETEFSLILTETGKKLSGTYDVISSLEDRDTTVTFANGVNTSTLKIRHGETLTIKDLPLGAEISVAESALGAGWSNSFTKTIVTAAKENTATDAVEVPNVGITNTYKVTPVQFQLKGTKNFEGANFPAGISFVFNAVQTDKDGKEIEGGIYVNASTVSETGKDSKLFQFNVTTFTGEIDRYYKITETQVNNLNGLTTSTKEYMLHLTVTENEQTASLELVAQYKDGTGAWKTLTLTKDANGVYTNTGTELTFVNKYEPLVSEPVTISGSKTLTGRHLNAGDFSFQLVKLAEEGSAEGTVIDTVANGNGTQENPSTGSFTFNPIVYTAADMNGETTKTFYYAVREVRENADNTTYDRTLYYVAVTVTDTDGKLVAGKPQVTQYVWDADVNDYVAGTGDAIAFQNVFTIDKASVTFSGSKTLTGDGAQGLDDEDFTFRIVEATVDNEGKWSETANVVAVAGNEKGIKGDGNEWNGGIRFSPINYNPDMFADVDVDANHVKTKHFYYIVKEDIPLVSEPGRDPSMIYDETKYQVEVVATYNVATGKIDAKIVSVGGDSTGEGGVTSYDGLSFKNIRNAQEIIYTPTGTKTTTVEEGKNLPNNLRFSFRVTNLLTGAVEGTGISAAATAEGNDSISFTGMEYDYSNVGQTFWYVIEEATVNMSDGVTYDDTQYILKLTVKKNDDPSFEDYKKYPVNGLYIVDQMYTLADHITTEALAKAIADGDDLSNWIAPYSDTVSFENAFEAEYSLNLSATKNLTGRSLKDNEFLFRLQLLTDPYKYGGSAYELADSVVNGSNEASGTVSFGTLNFTTAQMTSNFMVAREDDGGVVTSIYEYNALITEIVPDTAKLAGVEYDPARYIVAIRWEKTETPIEDSEGNESTQTTYGEPYVYAVYEAIDGEREGTVAKKEPALKTSFTGNDGIFDLGITFSNTYTVQTGTRATINATKTLSGRPLDDNEFGFELYRYDTEKNQENYVESATNKDGGVITFTRNYPATIDLDKYFVNNVATFVYHIKEIDTAMGGITYMGDNYWVKVVVEHDPNTASLKTPVVTYYESYDKDSGFSGEIAAKDVKFENKYEVSETVYTPVANKILLGADEKAMSLEGHNFSFEVVEVDVNGNVVTVTDVAGKPYAKVAATGSSNADGTVTFTSIKFSHADVSSWIIADEPSHDYYYMIRENQGNAQGVTYDPDPVYLKVTLTQEMKDNKPTGKLLVDAKYYDDVFKHELTETAEFENHYGPGYTVLNLAVNKTVVIDGRTDKYPLGASDFNFVLYADDGDGIFDAAKDTEELFRGTNGEPDANNVAPINLGSLIYTPADMVDGEGNAVPEKTFFYHVVEADVLGQGITKDPGVITVKVVVTHDGYGNLKATATYAKYNAQGVKELAEDGQNLFTNTYSSTPAKLSLTGSKTLVNKVLDQNEFTFVITEDANNPTKVLGESGKKEVTNDAGDPYRGEITFLNDVELKLPGEYTFTVSEKDEKETGYTYDSTVYTVKVLVRDTYEGSLEIAYTRVYAGETTDDNQVGGITFMNAFTPEPLIEQDLDLSISAKKQIVDAAGNVVVPDADNDMLSGFFFEILDNKGNSIFGEGEYGVSNADGDVIDFPTFSFDTAGEYHYIIREVDNEDVHKPGFTYDTTEWTLHILVRYNDGSKEVTYQDGDKTVTVPAGALYIIPAEVHTFPVIPVTQEEEETQTQNETEPLFSNVYDPTPVDVTVSANKTLTGRELKDHEFSFLLTDSNGLIHGQTGNHADGSIQFSLNYTLADMTDSEGKTVKEKTFNYSIVEVIPQDAKDGKLNGVTYATTGKSVSVKVIDDNGVLKVDDKSVAVVASGADFVNTYKAEPATVTISAQKNLTGADIKAFRFDFELVDSQGKVETVKNAADGSVTFQKTYTFDDMVDEKGERVTEKTFTYTLREKSGTLAGMTYDKDQFTVTVVVTDNLKGILQASVSYSADPIFENSYEGPTAVAVIEATKTLTGKSLKGDDFTFELVDSEGKVIAEAKNDDKGAIVFTQQYEAAGTYTYTIREKAGTDKRIAYDKAQHKVTVTVTADKDGYLTASVAYETDNGKAPAFKNTFTPASLVLKLEATKTLSGRKMKAEEFKFRVHDSEGNLVATGTNNAEGEITFTDITITQVGTYELTVSEVNSGARGMTYDKTKFKVTVVVTEEDGEMSAEITYPEDGIEFKNKYKKPTTSVSTGDDSDVSVWFGLMTLSMVAILLIVMDPYMKRKGRFSR